MDDVGWVEVTAQTAAPMETLSSRFGVVNSGVFSSTSSRSIRTTPFPSPNNKRIPRLPVLRCSLPQVQERADVFQAFLKERQLDGDIVSKVSDIIWVKDYQSLVDDSEPTLLDESPREQIPQVMGNEDEGGLLKLTKAYEWVLGEEETAPINKKTLLKEWQNDSDRRKRLNMLRYDAIKREIMLLNIGVGTVCSAFCLVAFSVQVAISYAVGVFLSSIYLQLLYQQVDNLSRESVPQIFMKKKTKKIGIRSEDLSNSFEKVVRGSAFVLSSPRLMLPVAIYGLWGICDHFSNGLFDFQIVPAMFGLFAYKAAALVQVYRDNEDLLIVFPESWESSRN